MIRSTTSASIRPVWWTLGTLALAFGAVLLALSIGPAEAATTFTVNRTGDAGDRRISDTVCDSSPDRGKQCTLRAALQQANAPSSPGADTINFNIGDTTSVKTIKPARPLPEITEAVTINGYTQPGASANTLAEGNDAVLKVQLNGTNAGPDANGLVIQADDSTVRGLVINRFDSRGIVVDGFDTTNIRIEGNFIGTNAAGSADLGNGSNGVFISDDSNTVGGTQPDQRNVISGNGGVGVQISGGLGTTGNQVLGNYIGTDKNGVSALGNTGEGVLMFGVKDNTVGGTTAGARNVISGNDQDGVQILGNASIGVATGNQVLGNYIGTDKNGISALGNAQDGVDIFDARGNTVGGTASGAGNVISGNGDDGVEISGNLSTDNQALGNFVGTDENGFADLGNGNDGVEVSSGADDNTIGGTVAGARNVISGNGDDGVEIIGGLLATGNEVLGNFIGTSVSGTTALGNSGEGVEISQAEANTVGGTATGARNVISANGGDGVVIFGTDATDNKVQGNFIGTDVTGNAALGNDDGVVISSGNGSTIGSAIGSTAGGNLIAHNQQDGVLVFGGAAVGNSILSNSIFSNGGTSNVELGIDFGTEGVTANDLDDPDCTGSNNRCQNFPVINSATRSNATTLTTISGTLNSNPSQEFTVQCFVAAPDPSGHGEGQIPVGQDTTVTTNAGGDASFSCVSPVPQAGQAVTATATNEATGDTSEFSQNVGVVPVA